MGGSSLNSLSSHVPVVRPVMGFLGKMLNSLDVKEQAKMVGNFVGIANNPKEMDKISRELAKTILKGGIDKEKLDMPEKLIDKLKSSFKSGRMRRLLEKNSLQIK
jgi:hypothetical protein